MTNSSLDLKEILHGALSKTLEVLEIEAGGIYLLQESDQVLHLAVHQGLSAAIIDPIDQLKMGEGFSGIAAQTAKPVIVWDIASNSRLSNPQAAKEGFRSLASFLSYHVPTFQALFS